MSNTIARNVTVTFSAITITGDVVFDGTRRSLILIDAEQAGYEVMSINFDAYNLRPAGEDRVFIKDWSEHTGVAKSLEAAGVVEITRALNVGPFRSRAYEVRVLAPTPAKTEAELVAA